MYVWLCVFIWFHVFVFVFICHCMRDMVKVKRIINKTTGRLMQSKLRLRWLVCFHLHLFVCVRAYVSLWRESSGRQQADSRWASFHNCVKTFIHSGLHSVWTIEIKLFCIEFELFCVRTSSALHSTSTTSPQRALCMFITTEWKHDVLNSVLPHVLFTWGRPLRLANVKLFLRGWTIAIRCPQSDA